VTYVRIIIGIFLFTALFFFKLNDKALIISLFCIGVLTDLLDGPIARGLNKTTKLGAMLDSTADKILIIPIAVYGLYKFHKYLLLVILSIEAINLLLSIYLKSKEIYLEENIFGKIKMVLFSIALIAILIMWPNDIPQLFVYVLWLTVPLSLLSTYFSRYSKIIEQKNYNKKEQF
jgi:CDP-diacylglycerol--glycerol-3-phosphate 3-phosphatidyltransferase